MNKDGDWSSDKDQRATCLKGKLDILKYCRKVPKKLTLFKIFLIEMCAPTHFYFLPISSYEISRKLVTSFLKIDD